MAKRKKQTDGMIAGAEQFVRAAMGLPANAEVYTISVTYSERVKQWGFLVSAEGSDCAIPVTYHPPVIEDGFLTGDVWAM